MTASLSARNVFLLNKIEHCLERVITGNVLRVVRKKRFVEVSAWCYWEWMCEKGLRHFGRRE
jgi:hypothetical protein